MPIVNYDKYCKMLDSAKKGKYAYPAINVSNLETANAALQGFAEAKSDGIIQVSIGGGRHASGCGETVLGAITLAEHIHRVAERYDVNIALHTDHCTAESIDTFLVPLIEESEKRVAQGEKTLFQSHMFDGGELPLQENLRISKKLFERCAKVGIILEVEIGVVGGEEDGKNNEGVSQERLYTTPDEMVQTHRTLSQINGRYLLAATFGNVHGVYKPGAVTLRPDILKQGQDAVQAVTQTENSLDLVFHGGSGSCLEDIHATLEYGVVKMNVDTDNQYTFSRAVAHHMFTKYSEVLKIDGEVGVKKQYDPRAWLKAGMTSMKDKVVEFTRILRSHSNTIG